MSQTAIDLWASFLSNEKLSVYYCGPGAVGDLVKLCEALADKGKPCVRPYKARLQSRVTVCRTAMDLGIDLTKFKRRGKIVISRGLLDAWVQEYQLRFGSAVGTAAAKEDIRRHIKSRKHG